MSVIIYSMLKKFVLLINLSLLGCLPSEGLQGCSSCSEIKLEYNSSLIFEQNKLLQNEQNAIESVVKKTLSLVNQKMPIENLKIIIRDSPSNTLPEIGIGGYNPNDQEVIISIDQNFPNLEHSISNELAPMLAHEIHHANRRRHVGYGSTLLEALVSEGLADCFAMEVMNIEPPIWSVAISGKELESWVKTAKGVWLDNSYNHRDWFFGNSAEIPRWVGYSIGYKLVKDFMQINTTKKPSNLFNESANSFKQ